MKKFEEAFEHWFFNGRWLLAPFFVGLLVAVVALLIKFTKTTYGLIDGLFVNSSHESVGIILTLVDTALLGSLLLIIAFSGYENFVSKFNLDEHEDRPAWMGKVSFADLKLKLMGAIVAISAVELLKAYINPGEMEQEKIILMIAIHITFVVSGVMFALTDYVNAKAKQTK